MKFKEVNWLAIIAVLIGIGFNAVLFFGIWLILKGSNIMFNDMILNCIVAGLVLIILFTLLYYMDKCKKLEKKLKTWQDCLRHNQNEKDKELNYHKMKNLHADGIIKNLRKQLKELKSE